MDIIQELVPVLASSLRMSVPLLFACLAGLWSERAGVFDIGLEGKMLAAAFAAAAVATATGSPWAALGAGIVVSIGFSLIHGFAAISQRGNQIVSGTALNFLAAGLTMVLSLAWYGQGGTPMLTGTQRFQTFDLPGGGPGSTGIVRLYTEVLSGHNVLVYLAFAAVAITSWALYRTRFGLRLRAVGENPHAVDTAGISVKGMRYAAVTLAGILCGFAGTYLSVAQSAGFTRDMSAGRGFIALAALVFAKWRPVPAMLTCLLFGFLDAFANWMQGREIPGIGAVPVQVFQALPYVMTIVLLAGFIGQAIPPKAGGVPYTKDR